MPKRLFLDEKGMPHPGDLSQQCVGVESVNGVQVDHWLLQANYTLYDNHYYATADASAQPVRFLEHVSDHGGLPKVMDFVPVATFVARPPPAELLAPPPACEGRCPSCLL